MNTTEQQAALHNIMESARRLGVEVDEAQALQWLAAVTADSGEEIRLDHRTGVFGHRITMLDFSDEDLAYFRKIGKLVEFEDVPGKVETALALSGSAAQSKIQTYPGDADFFERINILAPTRAEACQVLATIMREKAAATYQGQGYQLIQVRFGNFPFDLVHDGRLNKAGTPIAWTAEEVLAGKMEGLLPDGSPASFTWEEVAHEPGWCKLDWVVGDPIRKRLVNASNMLDVTWEAPDGSITPLDGYLDSFFQEVYLEAESIPIFSKLVKHVTGDALDQYVSQLESEVKKYLTKNPNYGKAAKRMYNIFRLTGRYAEAAYLRELFDEPTTMLYQVWSLIRTIEESFAAGQAFESEALLSQTDQLILAVVDTLEGEHEREIVRQLLRFRDLLVRDAQVGELSPQGEAAREELINIVNNFFYDKLVGIPEIRAYIEEVSHAA